MAEPKRLYRSRSERVLGGVCGGIAKYLDTDPTIIRLVWVLATLLSVGFGLIAYLVAWLIVPEEPAPMTAPPYGLATGTPPPPPSAPPPPPPSGPSTGPSSPDSRPPAG